MLTPLCTWFYNGLNCHTPGNSEFGLTWPQFIPQSTQSLLPVGLQLKNFTSPFCTALRLLPLPFSALSFAALHSHSSEGNSLVRRAGKGFISPGSTGDIYSMLIHLSHTSLSTVKRGNQGTPGLSSQEMSEQTVCTSPFLSLMPAYREMAPT